MSGHTPGVVSFLPSHAGDGYNWGGGIIVTFGDKSILIDGIDAMRGYLPESTALARLIAAAPELLAELQNIANADPRKWHEETRDQFQEWAQNRARAAIAKATGAQP